MPPAVAQFFAGSIRLLSVLAVRFIELTSRIYYVAALRVCTQGIGVPRWDRAHNTQVNDQKIERLLRSELTCVRSITTRQIVLIGQYSVVRLIPRLDDINESYKVIGNRCSPQMVKQQ